MKIKSQVWAVRHKDNSNRSDKMVHFAYFDTEKETYDYLIENDVNTESPHVEVNVYQTTLG